MPNIFDYLEWRCDIPFSADPFNEVDNLILAELAYTDFSGCLREGERTPLREAREKFFGTHSRELISKSDDPLTRAPLLMDGMAEGSRFGSLRVSDYVNIVDADKNMQMSAVTFLLDDGTAYIAFRGTDNTVVGWKEDFIMSYMPETGGQRQAIEYLSRTGKRLRRPLRVGGHSKGGNFAVYASAFCDTAVQDKIVAVYSNDGPGFRKEVTGTEEYCNITSRVVSIVPELSVIGMLLSSQSGRHVTVQSSVKGFSQHDGMTWQVKRNRFVRTEQSDVGRFIRDTQKSWLSKIDDESRESFVNSLFSLFESTGHDTFEEIGAGKFKSLDSIISAIQSMPKGKQQEFTRILGELLLSGKQTVLRSLSDMKEEIEKEIKRRNGDRGNGSKSS